MHSHLCEGLDHESDEVYCYNKMIGMSISRGVCTMLSTISNSHRELEWIGEERMFYPLKLVEANAHK